ncbi:MAG: hypothetical protein ACI8UD_002740, partial [Planctomycetota bacterium]
ACGASRSIAARAYEFPVSAIASSTKNKSSAFTGNSWTDTNRVARRIAMPR